MRGGGGDVGSVLGHRQCLHSIPREQVGRVMVYHRISPYLHAIVGDYFRGRALTYMDREEMGQRVAVSCGVPQRSVLGPLLWNLACNEVLCAALLSGSSVICYADDTLVLVGSEGGGL